MKIEDKKILILSADPWRDEGGDTTAQQLFSACPRESLLSVYFSPEMPDTEACGKIFQINELLFPRRALGRCSAVGRELALSEFRTEKKELKTPNSKKMLFKRFSKLPLFGFLLNLAREFTWFLGLWKESSFENFLKENSVDAVFFPVSKWMFHSWIAEWILKRSRAKLFLFFVDDSYTYAGTPWYFYPKQFFFRKLQRRLVRQAEEVFVISPKMKREYDLAFGRETTLLTKPVDSIAEIAMNEVNDLQALRFVYAGNLLYGRDKVLLKIATALSQFNRENGTGHRLSVYSRDLPDVETRAEFDKVSSACELKSAVPYSELQQIIAEMDVLVFVESFEKKEKIKTRLSFSTKITDYFKSGKLIWAVGPGDVSSIEYLKENDCAFVSDDLGKIEFALRSMMSSDESVKKCRNVINVVNANHRAEKIRATLFNSLSRNK